VLKPASNNPLQAGVRKREVLGWALYDFANSGYTTVVLTAVFNVYFVGVVAGNQPWATLAWTLALAASSLLLMVGMPLIGTHVDRQASKKRWLGVSTVACVVATLALATVGPGDVVWAMALIVVSNSFYGMGESLTAAFLPELATAKGMGRVSGWAWSLGYFGGMLSLGLSLAYVLHAKAAGQSAAQFVPVTLLITAAIYALAALPTFLLLRERAVAKPQLGQASSSVWHQQREVWRAAQAHPDFVALLQCTFAYQCGISVVIALAAVYAEQALGFAQTDTMMLVFLVNIAAAAGAFVFGHLQDRFGHRRMLSLTLLGWILMTLLAFVAKERSVFWGAAVLAGLCMGSSQSAGRAMVGLLAPAERLAEYFGLWTFATRLAAIVGPVSYGLVVWLTAGQHRLAILSTAVFFALGWWRLRRVDLVRGQAASQV
jgi:MFS transporter, UMF1 family